VAVSLIGCLRWQTGCIYRAGGEDDACGDEKTGQARYVHEPALWMMVICQSHPLLVKHLMDKGDGN
jgi:hypothetical protein